MLALVVIIEYAARLQISPRVGDIFAIKGTPNAARLQISPRVGSKKLNKTTLYLANCHKITPHVTNCIVFVTDVQAFV